MDRAHREFRVSCVHARLLMNREACRLCGRCVHVCPNSALLIDNGELKLIEDRCSLCTACAKSCAFSALSITIDETSLHVLDLGAHYEWKLSVRSKLIRINTPKQLVKVSKYVSR